MKNPFALREAAKRWAKVPGLSSEEIVERSLADAPNLVDAALCDPVLYDSLSHRAWALRTADEWRKRSACPYCGNKSGMRDVRGNCISCGAPIDPGAE